MSHAVACAAAGAGVLTALAAYRLQRRALYVVAKAIASAAFLSLALIVGAARPGWTGIALAGLALSAAGDVVLGFPGRAAFAAGIASFALAHAVSSVAFLVHGVRELPFGMVALLAAVAAVRLWRSYRFRMPQMLRLPAGVYSLIVSLMASTGIAAALAHGTLPLGLGAALVAASDAAVARERFGRPGFGNKAVGLPAYYLGQMLIAVSLGA